MCSDVSSPGACYVATLRPARKLARGIRGRICWGSHSRATLTARAPTKRSPTHAAAVQGRAGLGPPRGHWSADGARMPLNAADRAPPGDKAGPISAAISILFCRSSMEWFLTVIVDRISRITRGVAQISLRRASWPSALRSGVLSEGKGRPKEAHVGVSTCSNRLSAPSKERRKLREKRQTTRFLLKQGGYNFH